jgi:hypothetical protein
LVSPFFRRVLFVVAAAIRFATFVERPLFIALRLIFSYWRLRFGLFTPRGGIDRTSRWDRSGIEDRKNRTTRARRR